MWQNANNTENNCPKCISDVFLVVICPKKQIVPSNPPAAKNQPVTLKRGSQPLTGGGASSIFKQHWMAQVPRLEGGLLGIPCNPPGGYAWTTRLPCRREAAGEVRGQLAPRGIRKGSRRSVPTEQRGGRGVPSVAPRRLRTPGYGGV